MLESARHTHVAILNASKVEHALSTNKVLRIRVMLNVANGLAL